MLRITSGFMIDAMSLAAFSNTEETKMLLRKLLEIYQNTKKNDPDTLNRDMEVFWNIINDVVNADARLDKRSEIRRVCLKVKNSPIGKSDPSLVDHIEALLMDPDGMDANRIEILKKNIQQFITMSNINKDLKRVMFDCNKYNPDNTLDNEIIFQDIMTKMRDMMNTAETSIGPSKTIDMVDMTDPASVLRSINSWRNRHDDCQYPTGLQGLNRMLGRANGFQRGKFYVFASRSHNYKSSLAMRIAQWLTTLAITKTEQGKKPAVMFISLENETEENCMNMLQMAYTTAYKEAIPENMTDEQLARCVSAYYGKNGSQLIMLRKDDQFGYTDLLATIEEYEKRNLEIFAVIVDYLGLMRLDANTEDNQPKKIQKLAHSFHDLAARTNRIVVSFAQLGSEADMLASSGQTNIVKRYGAAHLSDCKSIRKEVDFLAFMEIERNLDEVPYLTFGFSKLRDETPPPKEDQYCAYQFHGETLGIVDDYGGKDCSCHDIFSDIGADTIVDNPFGPSKDRPKEIIAATGYGASPASTVEGVKPADVNKQEPVQKEQKKEEPSPTEKESVTEEKKPDEKKEEEPTWETPKKSSGFALV